MKWLLVQDIGVLVGLARRRCTDDKAGVRKAAVQLLEALLLLRASGTGGAEVVLPSVADTEAIQHAAADPMVQNTSVNCIAGLRNDDSGMPVFHAVAAILAVCRRRS